MAANDRNKDESEYSPWDCIQEARDKIQGGSEPEMPHMTTTKKLMSPQSEELEG